MVATQRTLEPVVVKALEAGDNGVTMLFDAVKALKPDGESKVNTTHEIDPATATTTQRRRRVAAVTTVTAAAAATTICTATTAVSLEEWSPLLRDNPLHAPSLLHRFNATISASTPFELATRDSHSHAHIRTFSLSISLPLSRYIHLYNYIHMPPSACT